MSPTGWHPDVFLIAPDFFITLFAFFGIIRLWKKERVFAFWLGLAIFFLLLWPTKWPQYILMLTVPLSLSASEGIKQLWQSMVEWWQNRKSHEKIKYNSRESRQAFPWLVPGLIAFTLLTLLPFVFQIAVSLTDFNKSSIRDGFQGGIWREFIGGVTGQIAPADLEFPFIQIRFNLLVSPVTSPYSTLLQVTGSLSSISYGRLYPSPCKPYLVWGLPYCSNKRGFDLENSGGPSLSCPGRSRNSSAHCSG